MGYEDQSITAVLDAIASENVTPAGGSATAVVGAMGAALCEMVCIHTIENAGDETAQLDDVREQLHAQRDALLDLSNRDAEAVDELLGAVGEGETQPAAKRATGVPLAIAEACRNVLDHAVVVTERGTPNAVPDAATAAFLTHGALKASVFTVRYNTTDIDDESFVTEMGDRTETLEESGQAAFEKVLANVETGR